MTEFAIKTEKLDDEQEEIEASVNRTAMEAEAAAAEVIVDEELERVNAHTLSNYSVGRWRRTMEHNSQKMLRAHKPLQQQQQQQQLQQQHQHHHQQRSLQSTTLQKSSYNNSGNVRSYDYDQQRTTKPNLPKSLCGEVFVSNNARQWTFVCTYCSKSTRDIGEFICHIKVKHLGGFDPDDGDFDDVVSQQTNEYEQDQNYLDCGSYLDVNVHTEPEDFNNFNGQETQYEKHYGNTSRINQEESQVADNAKKTTSVLLDQLNAEKKFSLVNNVDKSSVKTYNEPEIRVKRFSTDKSNEATSNNKKMKTSLPSVTSSTPCATKSKNSVNKGFDQIPLAYGDNDFTGAKNDQDTTNMDYEDGDYKDFDNQLLFAPTDSFDASTTSGGDVKPKRRPIRGTAYCELCDKTFQYYSLYRNHMIKHSNATPFKCTLCDKGFKSKQAIRYHMNTHEKEKQYKCTICYASYTTENQFVTHILTHEDEKTFPCMVCGVVLRSEKERDFHLTGHSEERPFRCEYCQKLFKLRHHLSNHLKLHRQYRCDFCKDEFNSAMQQRKPYYCPKCEKTVKLKENQTSADGDEVNPLQLFETVMTPGQHQTNAYAEMVTDSEEDDDEKAENMDDDQDEEDNQDDESYQNGDDDDDDDDDEGESESDGDEGDKNNDLAEESENYDNAKGKNATTVDGNDEITPHDSSAFSKNATTSSRYACKYCPKAYVCLGGLNHHVRSKHCYTTHLARQRKTN